MFTKNYSLASFIVDGTLMAYLPPYSPLAKNASNHNSGRSIRSKAPDPDQRAQARRFACGTAGNLPVAKVTVTFDDLGPAQTGRGTESQREREGERERENHRWVA